ncbi:MAG: response regulator [Ardenticatenaceae bacterium]|nr:response regulator [Anaerolineales bacterium]MCB8921127.1 response regulator [Ardenticatenaceae bacterium]MCB8990832.1 response regulator [Ardenticatenaceae bacterium]MCB9004474.1 response regulator [Ardenticatenaceae bacterium]
MTSSQQDFQQSIPPQPTASKVARLFSITNMLRFGPLLFILLALVLVITVLLSRTLYVQQQLVDTVQRERVALAMRDLNRPLTHIQEQLNRFAQNPDMLSLSSQELSIFLRETALYEGYYEQVAVLDNNGHILAAYPEDVKNAASALSTLLARRPYAASAWYLSLPTSPTEEAIAMILVPVLDADGTVIGYFGAKVGLQFVIQFMEETAVGETGYAYLLDWEQNVLITVTNGTLRVEDDLTQYPQAQAILADRQEPLGGVYEIFRQPIFTGLFGGAVIRQTTPVPPLPWLLVLELPIDEAYHSVREILMPLGVLLFAEILIVVGVGLFFAHRFAHPLELLLSAATEISAGNLETAVTITSPYEFKLLGDIFNHMTAQLRELVGRLEQRVAERTRTLDRRSMQIQAAAQTARDASAAYELDDLLNRAVNLIPSRFGYYHAGIFLVDDKQEYAVLRAATSHVGEQMLARRHKLKVNSEGIVGYVTGTGRPYITPDTRKDSVYWPNPLLPETLSEMGLPLKVSDRIIGAMNVQSRLPAAFEEEDITILQILADQLAVAIEKTRLFEQAQAQLTEQLNTVISNVPVILFSFDREGIITLAAGQGLETLGVAHNNYIGLNVTDIFRNDPVFLVDTQRALQGTAVRSVAPLRGTVWDVRYIPLYDSTGEVSGVIGVANDISERIQAEQSLQEKEIQLRQIVDLVPQMIFAKDENGCFLLANQAMADAYGTTVAELTGTRHADWHTHPEELAQFLQDDLEVLQKKRPKLILEEAFTDADGKQRVLQTTKIPFIWTDVLTENGHRIVQKDVVLGVSVDITERRQAEAALRQAQKLESLGVLAGGVAHDFNNLLVAILGQTSLALVRLPPESPARTSIEKATRAAERAADLTRQLLAYSGRGHFQIHPLNLNDIIRENLHLFEVAVPKSVQLRSELATNLPLVIADAGQIQQVIMNLILNGAEALGEKPGAVTVVTGVQTMTASDGSQWQITGEKLPPGNYVTLEVHDNGRGMDMDTKQRIFDPFFTTKTTGRGLGLAAVLGIVRGHRGGIRVYSEVSKGTSFKVLLPVIEEEYAVEDETAVTPNPVTAHILVVDDEQPVRETIADMLETAGFSVTLAANGRQGLDLYRENQEAVDLVLLDLSMPGLSGEETFRELLKINPQVSVILSSGYSETEATRRFAGSGLTGFLQKPYSTDVLIEKVRQYLQLDERP